MKKLLLFAILAAATFLSTLLVTSCGDTKPTTVENQENVLILPTPRHDSETSVEEALLERRSVRSYADEPPTLAEVSQLLWAAQGITNPSGGRTAPSAGALYPLEIYLLSGEVNDLPAGLYHYKPDDHSLTLVMGGDQRQALYEAALNQSAVKDATAVIVITAIYERTTVKYGERGIRYVHMEVGCVAQNIYLQAVSLDLGTVFIGAFHDDGVRQVLQLGADEHPLALMPVGRKQVP
jgi:SagB-type dehydrogenase family enzyme